MGLLRGASRGEIGDDFMNVASAHFRAFWELREWAVTEQRQLFQVTEKAFPIHVIDAPWKPRRIGSEILSELDMNLKSAPPLPLLEFYS